MHSIVERYLAKLKLAINSLDVNEISRLADAVINTHENNGTVFIAGNGGSASTSSHFATDLGIGSLKVLQQVRVISLTDNAAVMTAISNDIHFESVFEQQLRLLGNPGDLLILISASGNSKNLIRALAASQEIGVSVYYGLISYFDRHAKKLVFL